MSLACWAKHRIWNGKQSSSVQYRTVRHLVSFGYRKALCNQKLLTACQAQGGKAYDDDEVWNGEVQKADALPSMVTQTVTHLVFLGRDKLCVTKNFCHTKTCFMQIRRREPRWVPKLSRISLGWDGMLGCQGLVLLLELISTANTQLQTLRPNTDANVVVLN